MTKKSTLTLFVFFVCVMTLTVAHAYQISGLAQKDGASDHSGITVTLFDDPQAVPLYSGISIVIMLVLASFLLYHYGLRRAGTVTTAFSVLCIVGLAIAAQVDQTSTDADGNYTFNGIASGVYYIQASAAGYTTSSDTIVTVSDQNVTADDITLDSAAAPTNTPIPPTNTPVPTATDVPTDTPIPPTDTPVPTNTPIPTINCWHIPSSLEACNSSTAMRVPQTPTDPADQVWLHTGVNPIGGADSVSIYCDMTTDGGGWTLISSSWECNYNNNDYWGEGIPAWSASWNSTNQYYIKVTKTGYSDTYIYNGNQKTTNEATAQADPYQIVYGSFSGSAGDICGVDTIVGNLRYVPAGTFTQGSPGGEACRNSDETQFSHTLTRNIAVMETEITRQMWADLKAVQTSLPNDPTNTSYGSGMTNPVQSNTWYEAVLFANLLSVENGLTPCYYRDYGFSTVVDATNYINDDHYCNFDATGYRLLTEGEWEYATRAGTTGPFSCNETNYTGGTCGSPYCVSGEFPTLEQYAVYCANDNGRSEPVGSKLANPWNLKDVHGNVYEWCWDWYAPYPGTRTNYTGTLSGSYRVLRGGCWDVKALFCRSACRLINGPSSGDNRVGFRLVRTLP